jgi:RNA polymerase sigma-70 factor (ECF subfamily)
MPDATPNRDADPRAFPATRWTEVRQAAHPSQVLGEAALAALLGRYRPALKAHLMFVKRLSPEHAEDLLHDFIADKVLRHSLLAGCDPGRGRFRTYLLTALDRYTVSAHRRDAAQKRAPEGGFVELEEFDTPADGAAQTAAGDVEWARQVIAEALQRAQTECEATGRANFWSMFDVRVVGPLLRGEPPPVYEELVARLGFQSPLQASNALTTAKRIFTRMLREVVAEYAESPEAVETELHELRAILSQVGGG